MEIDNIIDQVLNGEFAPEEIARMILRNEYLETALKRQRSEISELETRLARCQSHRQYLIAQINNADRKTIED